VNILRRFSVSSLSKPKGGGGTPLPRSRFAIPSSIVAIAAVLVLGGALRHGLAATNGDDGASVYLAKCANCHQSNGRGAGPYPPLAGNPHVTAADTQQLIEIVVAGRYGPVTIAGRTYGAPMPGERGLLTNKQIAAVLTYVRSAWGNNAPAISEAQVGAGAQPIAFSGGTIFVTTCGNCHSAGGAGTSLAPPLDGNAHVTVSDPKPMIGIIVNGMSGPLTVNGLRYNSPMPAWRTRLSNADVAAVATYIRSTWSNHASAVTEQEVAAAGPAVASTIGGFIYSEVCASCHGARGTAPGNLMLAGNIDMIAPDPSAIIRTTKFGKNAMPSWKGQLSDADIASVLTYIRSSWGNSASAVTEAQVKKVQ
jgi:mono/diheme cytochrome c family protein